VTRTTPSLQRSLSLSASLALFSSLAYSFLFTSSTKTVVLGVPMLRSLYSDRSPADLAFLLLPLVAYHLLELVNGLVLAPWLKLWSESGPVLGVVGGGGGGMPHESTPLMLNKQKTVLHDNTTGGHDAL
jgi:hypothetical protein